MEGLGSISKIGFLDPISLYNWEGSWGGSPYFTCIAQNDTCLFKNEWHWHAEECTLDCCIENRIKETTKQQVVLYPNPTTGELTIDNEQLTINSVEVFDVYGRRQKSRRAEKQKGEGEVVINISHLANGIYFVEITTEKGVVVKKVIKQ